MQKPSISLCLYLKDSKNTQLNFKIISKIVFRDIMKVRLDQVYLMLHSMSVIIGLSISAKKNHKPSNTVDDFSVNL